MAYKFQLGAFTASGSIKAEEGFDAGDNNIDNVGRINVDEIRADGTGINVVLADNQAEAFAIKEGANFYMNFDTSDSAPKIDVIQDLKITDDKKLIFGTNSDASFEYDEDGNNVLLYAGANIRIPDDTKIEFGAAGDAGIEYDEDGTDQLRIHAATAGLVVELGGGTAFSIDSSGNALFAGNLTVQGETTTVDSTTINISSSFTFEGPADDHETILTCGAPTQDLTINLPQFSASAGAAAYHIPVLADAATAASAVVTAAEFSLLDGGTARGTSALADGDGFMHNDAGTMKHTNVLKIAEYSYAKISSDATVASNGALTIADNAVTLAKMAGLASGKLILGDSNGDPAAVTMSGDATLSAAGALTIAAGAVEHGMLAEDIISGQSELAHADIADADELMIHDTTAGAVLKVGVDSIRDHFFGAVSGDATVADGGALTIADNAVSLAKMAGLASGKFILGDSNGDPAAVTLSGDVTVSAAGAVTIANDAVESGMLNDNVISGQAELAVGDINVADEMMISDGGVLKKVGVDSLRTFINAGSTPTAFGDANATLVAGVNFASANTTQARTLTLPASPAVGQSVKVKVAGVGSGAVTIARAGSQTIDGSLTSIVLESDSAAVELVYVAADDWRVF